MSAAKEPGGTMAYTTELSRREGYLHVESSGALDTPQDVEEYLDYLCHEAIAHQTKRLLLDERQLINRQDVYEAYGICESDPVTNAALTGIRVACVCHPRDYELNKAYETLLLNRSLLFRVFLEEEAAVAWLLS